MTAKSDPTVQAQHHKWSVLVVDSYPVIRDGVGQRLNAEDDFTVCCQVKTAGEARQALRRFKPDVMVQGLALPDQHGLEFIKDVHAQYPNLHILVFSEYDESIFALRTLRAGANGFLMKCEPLNRLVECLRLVARGNYAVNPKILAECMSNFDQDTDVSHDTTTFTRLTDRELEVFELIGKGAGTREIAAYLHRSISAIETCRLQIKQKLRVSDYPALVCRAVRWVEYRNRSAKSGQLADGLMVN